MSESRKSGAPPAWAPPVNSRDRLLQAAVLQFAEHGYAAASIRAIAAAAGTNVASVSYHFGDKAGLYKAALSSVAGSVTHAFEQLAALDLSLSEALPLLYAGFLDGIDSKEAMRQATMRMHLRECAEPSPEFRQWIAAVVGPMFHQFERLVLKELGLKRSDTAVHRLALALIAIVNDYWISDPFIDQFSPQLRERKHWVKETTEHLTLLGLAMVDAEKQRRRKRTSPSLPSPR